VAEPKRREIKLGEGSGTGYGQNHTDVQALAPAAGPAPLAQHELASRRLRHRRA